MDIFKDENEVQGNWMSFKKVGDRIQGTLVGQRTVMNKLKGAEQVIYEILINKDSVVTIDGAPADYMEGDIVNVGSKPAIDAQMTRVRDGQIVGFLFQEEKKPVQPGFHPTKIIKVFAKSGVVDKSWLNSQPKDGDMPEPVKDEEDNAKKFEKSLDDSITAVRKEIFELAKEKLGAVDDLDVYPKVTEATGLPLVEENLSAIRAKLLKM